MRARCNLNTGLKDPTKGKRKTAQVKVTEACEKELETLEQVWNFEHHWEGKGRKRDISGRVRTLRTWARKASAFIADRSMLTLSEKMSKASDRLEARQSLFEIFRDEPQNLIARPLTEDEVGIMSQAPKPLLTSMLMQCAQNMIEVSVVDLEHAFLWLLRVVAIRQEVDGQTEKISYINFGWLGECEMVEQSQRSLVLSLAEKLLRGDVATCKKVLLALDEVLRKLVSTPMPLTRLSVDKRQVKLDIGYYVQPYVRVKVDGYRLGPTLASISMVSIFRIYLQTLFIIGSFSRTQLRTSFGTR